MERDYEFVTNNSQIQERYGNHPALAVEYLEGQDYLDVLIRVRDRIHEGWHLLTHPQASNLKPNQCPYKTILISRTREAQSRQRDLELIESAILAYHKFTDGMLPPRWTEMVLKDFRTVDRSVVESALQSSVMEQLLMEHR